ncbi:Pro-Pol poly, partial [Paramuricea clavata]
RDRTEGNTAFQVVGVDYAGPLKRLSPSLFFDENGETREGKAYIILFACSLTRALHLDLAKSMEMEEFLLSFKSFVARRGRPEKVYSDNGRTFVGAASWIKKVRSSEKFNDFLAHQGITWQFNLSKAPWWGGQFERMVGLVKGALRKSIGKSLLTFTELKEVLLDVEVALNNRPLSYVEDDIQMPLITPENGIVRA